MNYLAILVVAVVAMLIGALRYGPLLFGRQWMSLMGWSMNDKASKQKAAIKGYIIMFVGLLLTAYMLSWLINATDSTTWMEGAHLGLLLWAGITLPVLVGATLREGRNWGLFLISIGYQFVIMLMMTIVLTIW